MCLKDSQFNALRCKVAYGLMCGESLVWYCIWLCLTFPATTYSFSFLSRDICSGSGPFNFIDEMGGCVSTSSRSTSGSMGRREEFSPTCCDIGFCGQKRTKRTFADHVIALHHLPSVPNRVFTNGKSRSSCIFTQQGRKGINQDAMIVWEVSF